MQNDEDQGEEVFAEFNLQSVPAEIQKMLILKVSTSPRGGDGNPVEVFEVEVHLEMKPTDVMPQVHALGFPDAKVIADMVSGDAAYKGLDISTRNKQPEVNVLIAYRGQPVVHAKGSTIKARAQLKVDAEGDCKLILRPILKVDVKELVELARLIKADVRVTMDSCQMSLPESTMLATGKEPPPAKMPRKKKGSKGGKVVQLRAKPEAEEQSDPFAKTLNK